MLLSKLIFIYVTLEINASPRNEGSDHRGLSVGQVAIPRRKSSSSSSTSSSVYSDQAGYPPSSTSPNTPPFVISRERRISAGAAGSALAKAISMASERLFGSGNSPPNYNRLQQTMVGSPRGFLIMGAAGHQQLGSDEDSSSNNKDGDLYNDDNRTMIMIEQAACMGHAVAKFADTKFELLVSGRGGVVNESALAAEALVLHLKALALLEFGFKMAKKYWHRRCFSDTQQQQQQQQESSSRSSAVRLNDAVQWMRERFNECLDRASFEKSKCDEQTDPANSDFSGNSACVEKLLYDRALEMVSSDGYVIHVLTLYFLWY